MNKIDQSLRHLNLIYFGQGQCGGRCIELEVSKYGMFSMIGGVKTPIVKRGIDSNLCFIILQVTTKGEVLAHVAINSTFFKKITDR